MTAPHPSTDQPALPSLSIVIPAFNEEQRLGATLDAVRRYAERQQRLVEVIVVDDGSTDGTADLVRQFDSGPRLTTRLMIHPQNQGKGASVRNGLLAAAAPLVLMCDADMNTPVEEVESLLPWIDQGFDIVIGSRAMPGSQIDPPRPVVRRVAAGIFHLIRRRILLPRIRDTQCGFKLFQRRTVAPLFAYQITTGYGFDCEILGLAEMFGLSIREVGVSWASRPHSHVRPVRDGLRMLRELMVIRQRLSRLEKQRAHSQTIGDAGAREC